MAQILIVLLVAMTLAVGETWAHSYHWGDCPHLEPVKDFDMNKFLGVWYVVEKTSSNSKCLKYNFTLGDEPGEYKVDEIRQHSVLGLSDPDRLYHYTGNIKVPDRAFPARMNVKFPLSVAGKSSFVVFSTDYDNYAGLFTCQNLVAANRRSASIMSRFDSLDNEHILKMKEQLKSSGVNPDDLKTITHVNCPTKEHPDIDVRFQVPDSLTL